jgi:putative membrane protein
MFTDGFLGYRTSFMLDFVVCALILIVPLLLYSLYLVKFKRQFTKHKWLQLALGIILLFAVGAFEIDLQIVHGGWENIVLKSHPEEAELAAKVAEARPYLRVHLLFAVTTPILWFTTLVLAFRRFDSPPQPGQHSRTHKTLGWLSTIDITLTAVTGLVFYYVAFMTS